MGNLGEYHASRHRRARPRLAATVLTTAVMVAGAACTRPGSGTPSRPTTPATRTTLAPPTTLTTPTTKAPGGPTSTAPPTGGGSDAGPAADWNPPAQYVQPLADVWAYTVKRQPTWQTNRNLIWDQVVKGKGTLNYCVRWESSAPVTAAQRDRTAVVLEQQFNKWMQAMTENGKGWNGWPYPRVKVNIVGWATADRSLLQWADGVPVYTGTVQEGAPICPASAGFTLSLWLTAGMNGGTGSYWGERIGSEYLMGALGNEDVHILEHEMGHGLGLEDFYDWSPSGVGGFVMKAGSAMKITEFDKWMARDWWRHIKSRYQR